MKNTTSEITDFYKCNRCEINSDTEKRMCPCPKCGCEAFLYGKKVVTTEIISLSSLPNENIKILQQK